MAMGRQDLTRSRRAFAEGLELAAAIGDDAVAAASATRRASSPAAAARTRSPATCSRKRSKRLALIPEERGPLFWAAHLTRRRARRAGPGRRALLRGHLLPVPRRPAAAPAPATRSAISARPGARTAICGRSRWSASSAPLAVFRTRGDPPAAGVALNALGNLARSTGELEAGRRWLEEALAIRSRGARRARDRHHARQPRDARAERGRCRRGRAADPRARWRSMRATTMGRACRGTAVSTWAASRSTRGDRERACDLLEESARLGRQQDLDRNLAWALMEPAEAARRDRGPAGAHAALTEARGLFGRSGARGTSACGSRSARGARGRLIEPMLSGC